VGCFLADRSESWGRRIRSWVPWDMEPRMTVLARTISNLSGPTKHIKV
jgi:hypothetical protein